MGITPFIFGVMTLTDKLVQQLKKVRQKGEKLTFEETLMFLKDFKNLSKHPQLLEHLISNLKIIYKANTLSDLLTERENEIFCLIGLGFNSREIGDHLNISTDTVSTHRKNMSKKFKVTGNGSLLKLAYEHINQQNE